MYPVLIPTERLVIRELTFTDAEAIYAYGSQEVVTQFMPWPTQHRVEDAYEFLHETIRNAHSEPRKSYDLPITLDGRLIGMIGLHNMDNPHRNAEMGYVLHPDYWGQGYMTEAASAMIGFAFYQLDLHRIYALHAHDNEASGRVLQRIGMTHEGVLRHGLRAHDGVYHDADIYGIIHEEQ